MRIVPTAPSKRRKACLLLGGVCLLVIFVKAMGNPTNFTATRPDHSDPQLRTRIYRVAPSAVAATVAEIVPYLRTYGRRWRVKPSISSRDETIIMCEVPVLLFTDDLKITIREQDEDTRVDVESRSRIGRGDFGENRRHVIQLLHALDATMEKTLASGPQQS